MRRNASTVVVLAGSAPGAVLAAVGRSMNVTLIQLEEPADSGGDGLAAAAGARHRAGRATSPYALVAADPLAAVAAGWRAMWDVSRPQGPAEFEQEAVKALAVRPLRAARLLPGPRRWNRCRRPWCRSR